MAYPTVDDSHEGKKIIQETRPVQKKKSNLSQSDNLRLWSRLVYEYKSLFMTKIMESSYYTPRKLQFHEAPARKK